MTMNKMHEGGAFAKFTAVVMAVCLVLTGAPAFAQSGATNDLDDLVGVKSAEGENQLGTRGFILHHTAPSRHSVYSYWWQVSKKKCVRVRSEGGRYTQVVTVTNSDCAQKQVETARPGAASESKASEGANSGAGVAVGVAVLLGVAALAHKSHHRDDRDFDERQTADFERGFRDGQYNHPYRNYDNSREYSEGYDRGVDERGYQSSYRPEYRDYQGRNNANGNWVFCASEDGECRVPYRTRVRFGVHGRYNSKEVHRSIACSNREFGDPANGERKRCEYEVR